MSPDNISGNTPLQTSADSDSELVNFSSSLVFFSSLQLSLSLSLSEWTSLPSGSSTDHAFENKEKEAYRHSKSSEEHLEKIVFNDDFVSCISRNIQKKLPAIFSTYTVLERKYFDVLHVIVIKC